MVTNDKSTATTVEPGTESVSRIVALTGTGRNATDTRNVLVIRELALGVGQAAIVNATEAAGEKLDKGTVSRLNTQLKSLKPAQVKLILAVEPTSINPDDATTWADVLKLAAAIRPGKLQAAPRTPKERDLHAEYFEWVTSDPAKTAERLALMVAAVETWQAEQAAELAAA
jgi:hypothetical protein